MLGLTGGDEGRARIMFIVVDELIVSPVPFIRKVDPRDLGDLNPDGGGDGCRRRIKFLGSGRCEGVGYGFMKINDCAKNLEAVITIRT